MITYGGERVTLQSGAPSLNTLGVSLGRIVRFCGHTEYLYSVLAHSFVVAELVAPEERVYAFLHDTPETMVSDVPTPMKSQVARNRERVLLERIYIANGLPWPIPEEIQESIDDADHKALIAEAHILKHPGAEGQWGTTYDSEAGRLTRKYAKKVFEWLDPTKSGPAFDKAFKKYYALAGLNEPGEWK